MRLGDPLRGSIRLEGEFMPDSEGDDTIWHAAVEWVIRKHGSPLDAVAEKELSEWLAKDHAHRVAYEEASRLWLLTGRVPRSDGSELDS